MKIPSQHFSPSRESLVKSLDTEQKEAWWEHWWVQTLKVREGWKVRSFHPNLLKPNSPKSLLSGHLSLEVCRHQRMPSYQASQHNPSHTPVSVALGTCLILDLSCDLDTSCSFGLRASGGDACTGRAQASHNLLGSPPFRDKMLNFGNPIFGFLCPESSDEDICYTVTQVVMLPK